MIKSRNKFRHKWIDEGRAKDGYDNYCYDCKHCGRKKIKQSAYSASYYEKDGKPLGDTAPECVKRV